MRPFFAGAVVALFSSLSILEATAQRWGFPYGDQKVRGVNLGGWLVLEPWITPSLFDNTGDSRIIDEWTFGQYLPRDRALAILRNHWETWITEADFAEIAGAGLNHVRLPVGYWAFEVGAGEPFISGQLPYVERAIGWAQKYGLKVVFDLHGAPGSQNGFDNSGRKLDYPTWHTQQSNIARTNAVIGRIADMYRDNPAVVPVIAPLNEPAGYRGPDVLSVTRQFWHDSYGRIRWPYGSSRESNTVVMISDAFQPLSYWDGFMPSPNWQGVMLDTHHYQIFNDDLNRMSPQQHINMACNRGRELAATQLWVVVGEWSPARTDCAKYLNGRGVGSRYDGTYPGSTRIGSCSAFTGPASGYSGEYKNFLRQFWEAQTIAFERWGEGWIQWTWKAEVGQEWAYQAGLRNGWIPQNPTNRQYPNICG